MGGIVIPSELRNRVVLTSGCFDVFHPGHVQLLRTCRELANSVEAQVMVILNSDVSVRLLKGHDRPVNWMDDRRRVLEACRYVDHVWTFSEATPTRMIEILSWWVKITHYVKGPGYEVESMPEGALLRRLGAEIVIATGTDHSTTEIVDRVRRKR